MEQRAAQSPVDEKLICLAAVTSAHGIRGAFKLRCFTEAPENVTAYGSVRDETGTHAFKLRLIGPWKGGVIVKAEGIDTRNQAEALIGKKLFVPRTSLPNADEDEFYFEDLIGLVALVDDEPIGRVSAVDDHGAAAILEIDTGDNSQLAVPFTRHHVPEIDLPAGHVRVVIPQALGQ